MNLIEQWAHAIPSPKSSVVLSPEYIKLHGLHDECMMAIAFGYPDELCRKLFVAAAPMERKDLLDLFNQERIHCEIDGNNNFIIKN